MPDVQTTALEQLNQGVGLFYRIQLLSLYS